MTCQSYFHEPLMEACGEADIPLTIPGAEEALSMRFMLLGHPGDSKSPFADEQSLRNEPAMALLGKDFLHKFDASFGAGGIREEQGSIGIGAKRARAPRICSWRLDSSIYVAKTECSGSCGGRYYYCKHSDCQKKDWKAYHSRRCSKGQASGPAITFSSYPW